MNDPSARERELIRDAFGYADGYPAGAVPPVEAIVRRGRRARRTRSVVTASAAVLLIATCGSVARIAASATSATPAPPAATSSPSPGAVVSVPARAFDPNHWQTGPAHPQVGVAYKFDLLVHCGIRYAEFGGHSWQTSQHLRVPEPTPNPSTGVTTSMPALPGYMTLVSADTARFEVSSLPEAVIFHRMGRQAPLCA